MLKLSIQKRRKTKRNRINEAFCQLERQVFIFRFASVCNDAKTFEFLGSRLSKHRERVIFFMSHVRVSCCLPVNRKGIQHVQPCGKWCVSKEPRPLPKECQRAKKLDVKFASC